MASQIVAPTKAISALGTITLEGESGEKFPFLIYQIGTQFERIGAVYYVSRRIEDIYGSKVHSPLYIGETDDLSSALQNHSRRECFDQEEANCISIYPCEEQQQRLQITDDLIANYGPICNDNHQSLIIAVDF